MLRLWKVHLQHVPDEVLYVCDDVNYQDERAKDGELYKVHKLVRSADPKTFAVDEDHETFVEDQLRIGKRQQSDVVGYE